MHDYCRSPVFNAMFIHNTMESQRKEIKIEDLDIETVQDMLKYMYAGKIENLNTRSPRLLEAADKYQLSELKEICEVRHLSGEKFLPPFFGCAGGVVRDPHCGLLSGVPRPGRPPHRARPQGRRGQVRRVP